MYNCHHSLSHPDIQVGASVVQEQCEAEGDMSLQQRVLMGAGTALEGSSELVEDEIAAGMYVENVHCPSQHVMMVCTITNSVPERISYVAICK